ncbi:protein rolling stone [Episyrphus balteatus]|uniref:protein rolling stone n=1 Tax=Episyrphus balteatus TaxID=286459 RepID=UPI002484E27F|nr:protein rolling stone [Episyrphus balteatus]XP_055848521.1 protein rolling stone [Episyrphus balteatus]XP_055848522.1 protein rolling stone [Episyrphus balteatus]XP_055848524.1 protein rolling stone [Episyrphus balteatus]
MMVSKLWNSCFPEFSSEHVHRHNFYLCQWQRNTQVRIVYLFYRWITAITCLAALVCSLLDIGRTEEQFEHHYAKWWIYLTHWGLLACTIQAWLGAWIVTQGMMVEREDFEIVRQAKKSRLHHLYWVMYTVATVYSFIITMCYWLLVHNPEIHRVDALNIMVHVFNSVIMLTDLAIVGHPIKLSHAYWTMGIGLSYAIFTGIYFLAGGTDRKNQTAIYPLLDWTKPGKAIVVTVCAVLFVFVVHFGCYLLYRCRIWLFTKLCIRESHNRDGDMGEGLNEDTGSRIVHECSQQFIQDAQQQQQQQQHQYHQQHHQQHHHPPPQQQQQQQQVHQHQQQQQQQQHPPLQQYQYSSYHQDNNNKNKMSSLSRTVSALEAGQREQFLNPNKILEYKM